MPLLDRSGAEPLPDSNPENLVKFGIMGCVFLEDVLARTNPSAALMSFGEEDIRGNDVASL